MRTLPIERVARAADVRPAVGALEAWWDVWWGAQRAGPCTAAALYAGPLYHGPLYDAACFEAKARDALRNGQFTLAERVRSEAAALLIAATAA